MSKGNRSNKAISEIFGTLLLLGISVTLFSTVYAAFFTIQPGPSAPSVNIVGTIQNNTLILEHRGGESIALDAGIILGIPGGFSKTLSASDQDYLSTLYKEDGKWDIGEAFVYPLGNDSNFSRFNPIDITVVDFESSSVVMRGTVQEARVADVKITISVSDYRPLINSYITITINASNPNGPSSADELFISYLLPSSLMHISHSTSQGTYDNETGVWNVGNIGVGNYSTLTIVARIAGYGYNQTTQFVIMLDGSGSIDTASWQLAIDGLASAVANASVFPRDGSTEITIIQFGKNSVCAQVEVGPVVVYENNYQSIITQINAIKNKQGTGWTPMAAAFYLGADTLFHTNNFGGFNPNYKQVALLVTDGNANVKSSPGDYCGTNAGNYDLGKSSAASARNYLLNTLQMTDDKDEVDVIAVNPGAGQNPIDDEFLCDDIVWPEPCYDGVPPPGNDLGWPPPGPGWYRYVQNWQEFHDTIGSLFKIIFGRIVSNVELIESAYLDLNSDNNFATIILYPRNQ